MGEPCQDRRFEIQELLDGELPAGARAALEAHLAACAGCRAYQASMAGLVGRLDAALKAPGPGPQLEVPAVRPEPGVVTFQRRRAWAGWGVAAAAVLLVVGVSLPRLHGPVEVVATAAPSAAAVAEQGDDGQAILTWFGPEADSDSEEL
jgi:anti-sigma factor RsiW